MVKAPRHKHVSGSGGIAPPFLTSVLGPGHFTPNTHWIGGLVGA
jgi:hypothetical protein